MDATIETVIDVQRELQTALEKHTVEGIEMILRAIRITPSDSHNINARRLAELITADLSTRFEIIQD